MFLRHAWLDLASGSPIWVGDDEGVYGAKTERVKIFSGASGTLSEWLVS